MAGLRLVTLRTSAGEPVLDAGNGEELAHVLPAVSLVLGDNPPLSPGTLYITTRQVVWLSDTDKGKGYAVDFCHISLHAVSRDPEAYPFPCIYAQIDNGDDDDDDNESGSSDGEPNETFELSGITEFRLVPSDSNQVEELFEILCECAELNPEPIEEEEQEHNWIFSADQLQNEPAEDDESGWMVLQNGSNSIGCSNGDDLSHTVLQLQINDNRFEDAEEMDSEDINQQHRAATG